MRYKEIRSKFLKATCEDSDSSGYSHRFVEHSNALKILKKCVFFQDFDHVWSKLLKNFNEANSLVEDFLHSDTLEEYLRVKKKIREIYNQTLSLAFDEYFKKFLKEG